MSTDIPARQAGAESPSITSKMATATCTTTRSGSIKLTSQCGRATQISKEKAPCWSKGAFFTSFYWEAQCLDKSNLTAFLKLDYPVVTVELLRLSDISCAQGHWGR